MTKSFLLSEYLKTRAMEGCRALGFSSAKVVIEKPENVGSASEKVIPISFGDKTLGFLHVEGEDNTLFAKPEIFNQLQDLAAQFACILNSKNPEQTLAVDDLVERLASESPYRFHWTGVYLLTGPDTLTLEAFRGEATPHVVIPVNTGICGAAVREEKTLNIKDVKADSRYLSCSIKTKSELVVPLFKNGKVVGEIDIDSHIIDAFGPEELRIAEKYTAYFADILV